MIVNAYKTHKIGPNEDLFEILDSYLPSIEENSIVVIASKIVGICEGRVVKKTSEGQKDELVRREADYYLPREFNQYGFMITINENLIVASAGIDESNSNGYYSLWPKDPQKSTNDIRDYLAKKHNLKHIGVVLNDSKLSPLRWGVTAYALKHSGFKALNSYVGVPDIYGLPMRVEQSNIADSLANAAVLTMGEGAEQKPLAVITDLPFVQFQDRNPTQEELDSLNIEIEDDVYASILTRVDWQKGK